jgi:guanosine-3',5'-bis(diphosphate) 3'-pyrophosphohydrolase
MTTELTPEQPSTAIDPVDASSPVPPLVARPQLSRPQETLDTARRMRARLARLSLRATGAPSELEPVLAAVRVHHPKADVRSVRRAYELAEEAHRGQTRNSGAPYITHPVAVTQILADLGMDVPTLCAALLHDTVEDTEVELELIRREFGDLVALVVDGVTKLDKVHYGENAQAETVRKMVIAMSRDPRVLVVKLADRLHNMRTLGFQPQHKQERTARETLEILAPLAHRLGLNTLKWELEDLSFATLYPKRYDEIVRLVAERAPARDELLTEVTDLVEATLSEAKIKASVTGRPKHYYSIYQKMIVRGRDFNDIYDLVGIRVVVESVRDCYAVLGAVHAVWSPVPGRFKDYIARPKFNLYQSLHTTVIGPTGKPVELQIRSGSMHKLAEYGIAAHWRYKETRGGSPSPSSNQSSSAGEDVSWLRQIVDWQRETSDPVEFLDALRFDLHSSEVFVFTPKGDVISLPAGATPIDFAYGVHTEVGHRCIGARVNGRLVALDSELRSGDAVEVFTTRAPGAGPSRDWITFAASARARTKIRQWFAKERREDAVDAGKDALTRAMRKAALPLQRILSGDQLTQVGSDAGYEDLTALYAAIGENHISAQTVVERIVRAMGGVDGAVEDIVETAVPTRSRPSRLTGTDPGVSVKGVDDVWIKLARCCTPVPGDPVVGFVTRGHGVSVHRTDCANVADLLAQNEEGRTVEVEWTPSQTSVYLVNIQVEALDRHRLLADVTRVLSEHHVNILSASVMTRHDRVAMSRFTFEMGGPEHLETLLGAVRGLEGVYDVYRLTTAKN